MLAARILGRIKVVKAEDWVSKRINEARSAQPSVTDVAATRIEELIRGKLRDRQLSTAELREVAKKLLANYIKLDSPIAGVADED